MQKRKIWKISLIVVLSIVVVVLMGLFFYINQAISSVKAIDTRLINEKPNYSTFYNANNEDMMSTQKLEYKYVTLDNIPEITRKAFISIEDKNFYKHNGLNLKRIAKAAYNNLVSKDFVEGASTITQQLVKNKYLSNEKTIDRKIKEAYLAIKLEKNESKDKILESYLNTIYFGNGAYGIGDAAKVFFDKEPQELNLSESAILAGCIKSPSYYSPINNYENAMKRKNIVLQEMLEDKYITLEEYEQSTREEVDKDKFNKSYISTALDLYTKFALHEASQILNTNINNVLHGGYKIYTFKDNDIQNKLDKIVFDEKYYQKNEYGNIADSLSIVMNNMTHGVSAVSGKSNYDLVNIKRQPGSLVKPIITFMPGLEEGVINSQTRILDEEINIDGYSPKNVGNKYYGYISVEDVVAKSLNVPTIKISEELGLSKCIDYAEKCGIEFDKVNDYNYSTVLGGMTNGVTLKDITDAYSPLVNNGNYSKSAFVSKIENNDNVAIYSNIMTEKHVYNDDTVYLMTDMLKYSVENGTSKKLSNLDFDVAGKTGTVAVKNSNYNTDAYSLAYTTEHTMSVWLGNYTMQDKYNLNGNNNGGTYATEIIRDTFDLIYEDKKPSDFMIPDSVQECIIDRRTLEEEHEIKLGNNIPTRYQSTALFSKRYLPSEESDKFSKIDNINFDLTENKNSVTININTFDYIDYYVYRSNEGYVKLIKTITNSNDKFSFVDYSIIPNTQYEYYIVAKSNYSDSELISQKKSVIIKKDYNEIINDSNSSSDLSWIFA